MPDAPVPGVVVVWTGAQPTVQVFRVPSGGLVIGQADELVEHFQAFGREIKYDFEVKDQTGQIRRLSDFRGQNVVLWFYPKADTPG